jgi:hypothetical protein
MAVQGTRFMAFDAATPRQKIPMTIMVQGWRNAPRLPTISTLPASLLIAAARVPT